MLPQMITTSNANRPTQATIHIMMAGVYISLLWVVYSAKNPSQICESHTELWGTAYEP